MSNRKLRNDLEDLKKEVEKLRQELAAAKKNPTPITNHLLAAERQPHPLEPHWPAQPPCPGTATPGIPRPSTISTCLGTGPAPGFDYTFLVQVGPR